MSLSYARRPLSAASGPRAFARSTTERKRRMRVSTPALCGGAVLRLLLVAGVAAIASTALAAGARADVGRMTRVSVTSTGAEAYGWSIQPHLSSDGRFVA